MVWTTGFLIDKKLDRWQSLWDAHIEGEHLADTTLEDAGEICRLGWDIRFKWEDYGGASAVLGRWFEHPEIGRCDPEVYITYALKLARSWLLSGDAIAGVELIETVLDDEPCAASHFDCRDALNYFVREQVFEERADPRFAGLCRRVLAATPGAKRFAAKLDPEATTNGELADALSMYFLRDVAHADPEVRRASHDIWHTWDRISFVSSTPDGSPPEFVLAHWQRLWETYIESALFQRISAGDTDLICSKGFILAMQQRDARTARERVERWFEHPRLHEAESTSFVSMTGYLAEAWIRTGEVDAACELTLYLLKTLPRSEEQLARVAAVTLLARYCDEQVEDEEAIAPVALTALAKEVLLRHRGRKRIAAWLDPGVSTLGDVCWAVQSLLPEPDEDPPQPDEPTNA